MRLMPKSKDNSMSDQIMPIAVIIPARRGSKRLLQKNTKIIAGKPLVEWTIDVALSCFDRKTIHVSTDDDDIIALSRDKGLNVTAKRPSYLSDDYSTTRDVVLYELDKQGIHHGAVLILQPTSPLRTASDITASIATYLEKEASGVVSVCECEHPPEWSNILPANKSMANFLKTDPNKRSQDHSPSYRLNGALYLYDVQKYRSDKNIINNPKTFAHIMPKNASIDIDDEFDFRLAEILLSHVS